MADIFQKQAAAKVWNAFDFTDGCTNVASPGSPDTVLSYTLKAYKDGAEATAEVLGRTDKNGPGVANSHGNGQLDTWHFQSGYFVFVLFAGGTAGQEYQWECNGETSSGQLIPLDATMKVIADR